MAGFCSSTWMVTGSCLAAASSSSSRIIDIALLPEHRNGGIGSRLLRGLLDEAAEAGKPVRIHVEQLNPAMSLYRRLGFTRIEERGVYWLMEWRPGAAEVR